MISFWRARTRLLWWEIFRVGPRVLLAIIIGVAAGYLGLSLTGWQTTFISLDTAVFEASAAPKFASLAIIIMAALLLPNVRKLLTFPLTGLFVTVFLFGSLWSDPSGTASQQIVDYISKLSEKMKALLTDIISTLALSGLALGVVAAILSMDSPVVAKLVSVQGVAPEAYIDQFGAAGQFTIKIVAKDGNEEGSSLVFSERKVAQAYTARQILNLATLDFAETFLPESAAQTITYKLTPVGAMLVFMLKVLFLFFVFQAVITLFQKTIDDKDLTLLESGLF